MQLAGSILANPISPHTLLSGSGALLVIAIVLFAECGLLIGFFLPGDTLLFAAGISPLRPAGRISLERYRALADAVKSILAAAIARGGTTLRDFISPDGVPGYFEQELSAYGRGGEPCPRCGRPLKCGDIGQRATAWCGHCQR